MRRGFAVGTVLRADQVDRETASAADVPGGAEETRGTRSGMASNSGSDTYAMTGQYGTYPAMAPISSVEHLRPGGQCSASA